MVRITLRQAQPVQEAFSQHRQWMFLSLSDGSNNVTLDASEYDGVNTGYAIEQTTSKDTVAPTVVINAPSIIKISNKTSYIVSGSCESGHTVSVTVTDGTHNATNTPSCSSSAFTTAAMDVSALTDGTNNVNQAMLTSTGGSGTTVWALASGSTLPAGLKLKSLGGITGTPTAAGSTTFSVQLTDSARPPVSVQKQLSINIVAPLSITTSSLPSGVAGLGYTTTLQSSGGVTPIAWTLASGSSLPPGLSLNSSGTISGLPSAAGASTFTVVATDSETPTPATVNRQLSITISAPQLGITTSSLTAGRLGSPIMPRSRPRAALRLTLGLSPPVPPCRQDSI